MARPHKFTPIPLSMWTAGTGRGYPGNEGLRQCLGIGQMLLDEIEARGGEAGAANISDIAARILWR
jgi:hypothetical protein